MNDPLFKKAGETEIGELGRMNEPEQLEQQKTESRFVEHDPLMEQNRMLDEKTRHFRDIQQMDLSAHQLAPLDQLEVNESLFAQTQSRMKAIEASGVAPGSPVQLPKAGKDSYKERKEKAKKAKKAKKLVPTGDAYTMDIVEQMKAMEEARDNAIKDTPAGIGEKKSGFHGDARILRCFCQGHMVNKKGEPLDKKEKKKRDEDRKFFVDYLSGDQEKRRPYLDKFTKELLENKIEASQLSDKYVAKHIGELTSFVDKATYFENLMEENKWYFDALPKFEQDMIQARIFSIHTSLAAHLTLFCNLRGFDFCAKRLYEASMAQRKKDTFSSSEAALKAELAEGFADRDKREKKALEDEKIRREYGDKYTPIIQSQLDEILASKNGATPLLRKILQESKSGRDSRVLLMLTPGFKVYSDGSVIKKDTLKREETKAAAEAYLGKDEEKVKPVLDRFFKDVLEFKFDSSIMNEEYLATHMGEIKVFMDKTTYIEQVMKDHPAYFEKLDSLTRERLMLLKKTPGSFGNYLKAFCGARAIALDDLSLMTKDRAADTCEDCKADEGDARELAMIDIKEFEQKMQKLTAGGGETGAVGA